MARGDRTPRRQSPPRGRRDARPSFWPDGSRKQSVHYRDGRRQEPRIYSFDEAGARFGAAIALLDANPGCAEDREIVAMLSHFALYATATWQMPLTTATVERFRPILDRVGDNQQAIVVQHHYANALLFSGRYREAAISQDQLSAMAARLGNAPAIAYAHTMRIHISTSWAPLGERISTRRRPRR